MAAIPTGVNEIWNDVPIQLYAIDNVPEKGIIYGNEIQETGDGLNYTVPSTEIFIQSLNRDGSAKGWVRADTLPQNTVKKLIKEGRRAVHVPAAKPTPPPENTVDTNIPEPVQSQYEMYLKRIQEGETDLLGNIARSVAAFAPAPETLYKSNLAGKNVLGGIMNFAKGFAGARGVHDAQLQRGLTAAQAQGKLNANGVKKDKGDIEANRAIGAFTKILQQKHRVGQNPITFALMGDEKAVEAYTKDYKKNFNAFMSLWNSGAYQEAANMALQGGASTPAEGTEDTKKTEDKNNSGTKKNLPAKKKR